MAAPTHLNLMHGASTAFIDVEGEIEFWRRAYRDHPAFSPRWSFTEYEPALRLGIEAFIQDPARTFEECRDVLGDVYEETQTGAHRLHWDEAGSAAAAAWHRLVRHHRASGAPAVQAIPGMPPETAIAS